jgi:glutathione S-transferase/GST-like protein
MSVALKLYYFPTPNGRKVSIALEEMGLAYEVVPVNILAGAQTSPAFLEISPNGRIPGLIDEAAEGGRVVVFESGAILQYLGRRSGRFYPAREAERTQVDAWIHWQMAGLGPMTGQINWFLRVAETPGRDPRESGYAIHRYVKETKRLYGVLERRLEGRDFICGDYSLADMASWPWVDQYNGRVGGFADYPNIGAWHARIAERPAVRRAMRLGMDWARAAADAAPAGSPRS